MQSQHILYFLQFFSVKNMKKKSTMIPEQNPTCSRTVCHLTHCTTSAQGSHAIKRNTAWCGKKAGFSLMEHMTTEEKWPNMNISSGHLSNVTGPTDRQTEKRPTKEKKNAYSIYNISQKVLFLSSFSRRLPTIIINMQPTRWWWW